MTKAVVVSLMSPKAQIRGDIPTREPHFVRFVKREGTGDLEGIEGAGIRPIKAVSPNDREFELTGEAVVAKK